MSTLKAVSTLMENKDTFNALSGEQLDVKLQHSYEQAISGTTRPASEVFAEIERRHQVE